VHTSWHVWMMIYVLGPHRHLTCTRLL
jgi:hypothetical protein